MHADTHSPIKLLDERGVFDGQEGYLPLAVNGQRRVIDSAAGRIAYYTGGMREGRPLLLVHSVNAAASAAEMRPLFEHYASRRPVYALDLPGFGRSQRLPGDYTPRRMTDAVLALVELIQRVHGPQPIDALGLSLGCEFVARAGVERKAAFRSLALVSPTGLEEGSSRYGAPGSSLEVRWMHKLLSGKRLGPALYRQLVRPGVIRYFLQRSFGSKIIDETLHAYCVLTAHQPGAEHAPLAFLSRQPFSADITAIYDELSLPVWLAHGTEGSFTDFRAAAPLLGSGRWQEAVFSAAGSLPHFQRPADFIARYDAFLQGSNFS